MDGQIGMSDLVMALKRPITGFGEKICTSRQGNVTADCLRGFLFFFSWCSVAIKRHIGREDGIVVGARSFQRLPEANPLVERQIQVLL